MEYSEDFYYVWENLQKCCELLLEYPEELDEALEDDNFMNDLNSLTEQLNAVKQHYEKEELGIEDK